MDQNNQDRNAPNVGGGPTGADFVAAALAAARAAGGGAGAGGHGAGGAGQNPGQGVLNPGQGVQNPGQGVQNQGQGVQNQGHRPLAPGGLAAVNNAINNVQIQLQLEQYDRETLMAEDIIAEQDQIIADALRKKKAAIYCIKAAAAKKSADLNSDKPMDEYYQKYGRGSGGGPRGGGGAGGYGGGPSKSTFFNQRQRPYNNRR